jgi:phage major head subunit gpT-like protein
MARITADGGRKLNITGTVLVVPPELEQKARQLLNGGSRIVDVAGTPVAVTNEWQGTADTVVTPFIDA